MEEHAGHVEEAIRALLMTQKLAVLSTHSSGQPYASLVAFAASDDLRHLTFATARTTRKFHNLAADPRVAMLMDSRSNEDADIHAAMAVTVTGTAREVVGPEKEPAARLFLAKHPYLRDFVLAPSCALIRVEVGAYTLVSRFQQVMELRIKP